MSRTATAPAAIIPAGGPVLVLVVVPAGAIDGGGATPVVAPAVKVRGGPPRERRCEVFGERRMGRQLAVITRLTLWPPKPNALVRAAAAV